MESMINDDGFNLGDTGDTSALELPIHRIILDNASDPIFSFDRTGKYLYVNHAFAAPLNKRPDDIIGRRIWDIFPGEEGDQRFSAVRHVFKTGDRKVIEVKVPKESEWLYYLTSVVPVKDPVGNVQIVICMSKDITLRKRAELSLRESEARYKGLFEDSGNVIGYYKPDGTVISYNKKAAENMGGLPEEFAGRRIYDLFPKENADLYMARITRAVMEDAAQEYEDHVPLNLGSKWFFSTYHRIMDSSGDIAGIQIISQDITQKKKTEQALLKAKKAAEVAANTKSRFLSNMSHEIRTPINGVIGMMQLLEMTSLTEEQNEYVRLAKISSDTLMVMLNDILDYSKMEAGKLVLEKIPFSIRSVVRDVVGLFGFDAANRQLLLQSSLDKGVPEILLGDPFRLRQILTNLVGNAVKFTKEGRIDIFVKVMEGYGNYSIKLEFSVKDTGIGILKEKTDLLFQRFSQVDSSDTRKYGGTGLGLAIAKSLVELMGGEIWVESMEGKGSCFSFSCSLEIPTEEGT